MKVAARLIAPLLALGANEDFPLMLTPGKNYNNGHSKYVPGNCPEGLTEEERKRKAKKQRAKERRKEDGNLFLKRFRSYQL